MSVCVYVCMYLCVCLCVCFLLPGQANGERNVWCQCVCMFACICVYVCVCAFCCLAKLMMRGMCDATVCVYACMYLCVCVCVLSAAWPSWWWEECVLPVCVYVCMYLCVCVCFLLPDQADGERSVWRVCGVCEWASWKCMHWSVWDVHFYGRTRIIHDMKVP